MPGKPPDPNRPDPPRSAAWLAATIGVTENVVSGLGRRGIIPRTPDNLYPIRASVGRYCAHLRDQAAARGAGGGAGSGLAAERLRHTREKADQVELANARTRGELVELATVEADWTRILVALRARLLAVPSRCASRNGQLTPADLAAIDREIRDALTELGTVQTENPLNAVQDASSGVG